MRTLPIGQLIHDDYVGTFYVDRLHLYLPHKALAYIVIAEASFDCFDN